MLSFFSQAAPKVALESTKHAWFWTERRKPQHPEKESSHPRGECADLTQKSRSQRNLAVR